MDLISRQSAVDKLTRLVNEFEGIMLDIREKNVDDSVCGLCEYDCDHGLDGFANECPGFERDDCFKLKDEYRKEWISTKDVPSAQPRKGKWIPHDCLGRPSIDKDVCSCCGQRFYQIAETGCEWNFCPNCGADMRGEQDG